MKSARAVHRSSWSIARGEQNLVRFIEERILLKNAAGHVLKRSFRGRFQNDGAGVTGVEGFLPAGSADAPAITWNKSGESIHWHGSAEIVAAGFAELEKLPGDNTAHRVATVVLRTDLAFAVPVESGEGRG